MTCRTYKCTYQILEQAGNAYRPVHDAKTSRNLETILPENNRRKLQNRCKQWNKNGMSEKRLMLKVATNIYRTSIDNDVCDWL